MRRAQVAALGAACTLAMAICAGCAAAALQASVDPAVVGVWWQSAWKLCKPVAQLAASDVDPPIDELAFRADGTFSVTWRGGGARGYNEPGEQPVHFQVPDYSGHYATTAGDGKIKMRIDNGIFVPRDFSGDGRYAINGNQLTLTEAWLGTRQAKKKPDICELTFTKK